MSPVEVGECPGHGAMLVLVANTDPRGGRGLERGTHKPVQSGVRYLELGFHQEYWGANNSSHYSSQSTKVQSLTGDHLSRAWTSPTENSSARAGLGEGETESDPGVIPSLFTPSHL